MVASSAIGRGGEVVDVRPVYPELRKLFLASPGAIEDLVRLLKSFSMDVSSKDALSLYVRMQWDIEADKEFVPAMRRGKHHCS